MARPPSLGCFGAGARGPGSLGVGARCGSLFSTYKSPKFYLSFTILVSFILVRYPDRIGLVNTVGTTYQVPVVTELLGKEKGTRKMLARTDKEA